MDDNVIGMLEFETGRLKLAWQEYNNLNLT